ncbi:MAG: hypothetical protein ACRC67_32165 [Inquilinus sp.]|jgi:hypothetical protein|uniref:hypothetical protein n=1 Tax=Bacteria TaxID=2 RepID=UPI00110FCD26|nr:hypothetical protein [Mycobacterium sp. KBS0706]TSD86711.1 hypothetical protein FFK22_021275 [Mycobacterium sp. KBS0706]
MGDIAMTDNLAVLELKTPMTYALDMVTAMGDPGISTVPTKPTAGMLAAGARAGGVTVEVAWRVFQAMVNVAD